MSIKHILLFILISIFVSNSIKADDIYNDSDSVIMKYTGKEIVIESFKQNNNLYVQPVAASLITSKEINDFNIVNIKEITSLAPNLYIPDYGSKMTSPAYIRGIGSHRNAPSVGLYVDGVPYFDRSSFDVNINDIDRIEILRGPQGTIYGRNTMGGIINIFTKSPFKYKGTNLNLTAGNYNNYQAGLSHYGNVHNKVGYAISGNYLHSGGYFKNITTNKKADPIDAFSTRGRLSWRIQPNLLMHLILAYEYSNQNGYPYRVFDKETTEMDDINYNEHSFYRRNMSTNGLNIEYVTDQFKIGSQSSFQFYDGKQGLDQDFMPQDLYYVSFYQRQQMYSQEFNIKSLNEDSRYSWQFGLFGFHQSYYQTNDTDNRSTKEHTIQSAHNPTDGFAAYHQSTIKDIFDPSLSLVLGLRYDWEQTKSTSNRTTPKGIEDPVEDKTSFSQITPKAALQYLFGKDGLAYFSVSKGYKTGGFNNTAERQEDRIFDPEYSWSYEVGSKSSLFNSLIFFDMSLFYIDWDKQQISQTKTGGKGFIIKNAGKSVSKGVELSAQINPLKNLNFQISYGYTSAKYKDYKDYNDLTGVATSYDNHYLPMVPRHTAALSANYTLGINKAWLDNIVLNAQYTGAGKIYWADNNDITQKYYNLLNGKISFVKKDFSIDLWAKNITNEGYISYYFLNNLAKKDYVQKGRPFTCGINMNLKF
ncbi:TonB-dependent receptor [Dysgonomonas sp. Marseille-P4677]|uniref:TonB-dependent receptor n=1 Tax=Dysgonomonas sp. Marseille-P4677 TaxID=2364790 RepID=UPI0019144742|nr:TonB-dependent receptor [Dysgonomonas sp. Marseille-P4677]MBK5722395.1 TonB-dependent receptor [Dysgonomonas sp. Marseille-P4677]